MFARARLMDTRTLGRLGTMKQKPVAGNPGQNQRHTGYQCPVRFRHSVNGFAQGDGTSGQRKERQRAKERRSPRVRVDLKIQCAPNVVNGCSTVFLGFLRP
jgi:hypothetical protein